MAHMSSLRRLIISSWAGHAGGCPALATDVVQRIIGDGGADVHCRKQGDGPRGTKATFRRIGDAGKRPHGAWDAAEAVH